MKLNPQAFARRFGEEMGLINHWAIWLELLLGLIVTIWTLLSQRKSIAGDNRDGERYNSDYIIWAPGSNHASFMRLLIPYLLKSLWPEFLSSMSEKVLLSIVPKRVRIMIDHLYS